VLVRHLLAALAVAAALATTAYSGIDIHATSAADATRDPAHVRTLRSEVARALEGARAQPGHTLDVSLVRLATKVTPTSVEVSAELRAVFSDPHGVILWSSSARAVARGTPRERALVERDAIGAAAQQLGRLVRSRI
jgi:hypothetical protein